MFKYKIAGVVFETNHLYSYTQKLCVNYLYNGKEEPEFSVNITEQDIKNEKDAPGGENFPDSYLECLALFRKLCDYVLSYRQGIIFHCSAVAVDGKAYLFTAPSGTGKSTHTRIWKKLLGDKMIYVNDDKPIIRYEEGKFYVYGTPWNGKHHLDCNVRVVINAICELKRGEKNTIEQLSKQEMLMTIMNQTLVPENIEQLDKFIFLIDKLLCSVKLYRLHCNISDEAGMLSYNTMSKGVFYEN